MTNLHIVGTIQPPHECPCGCGRIVTPDSERPTLKYFSEGCIRTHRNIKKRQKRAENKPLPVCAKHGATKYLRACGTRYGCRECERERAGQYYHDQKKGNRKGFLTQQQLDEQEANW